MKLKPNLSSVHLYAGLFAAVFVVVLGVTGAMLAFRDPIDRALNPQLSYVTPQPERKSLAELITAVEKQYPSFQAIGVALPERPEFTTSVTIRSQATKKFLGVALNQYTGQVLGDSDHANNLMDHVKEFHSSLLLGKPGETILWFCSVALVVLSISGIVLWTRRKRYGASLGSPVFTLDLHTAIGVYVAMFAFLFGITAMRPVPLGLAMKLPWTQPGFRVQAVQGAKRLSPDQLIAAAQSTLPHANPVTIGFVGPRPDAPIAVSMRYPEDHTDNGKSIVFLDPYTGKPVSVIDTRQMKPLAKYSWMWNWEIHTGQIFGLPTQILACVLSLVLPLLAVTGPVVWWQRRKRTLAATPSIRESEKVSA